MKVAPKTLKMMAVSGTLTISGGSWYAAEQAIAYGEAQRSGEHEGSKPPQSPSPVVELGQEILDTGYWLGVKTGLIRPPVYPCPACGMG